MNLSETEQYSINCFDDKINIHYFYSQVLYYKKKYHDGKMSQKEINFFESLPGWNWGLKTISTKESIIKEYQQVISIHPEAISSCWMKKNGYSGLYARIQTKNGKYWTDWNDFKRQAGINDKPLNISNSTKESIIKEYQEVISIHPEAINSKWMLKNGYSGLYTRIQTKNGKYWTDWNDFKRQAGINKKPLKIINSTKESIIKEYQELISIHPEAISSRWMSKNGYLGLYTRIQTKNGKYWTDFNDFKRQADLYSKSLEMETSNVSS